MAKQFPLVKKLLVDRGANNVLVAPSRTFVGAPFVTPSQHEARMELFNSCEPISVRYADASDGESSHGPFVTLFENLGAYGPLVPTCKETEVTVEDANKLLCRGKRPVNWIL
jgi:hypothetical protein